MRRQRLLDVKLWLRNEAALSRAVHPAWRTESSLTKAATDPLSGNAAMADAAVPVARQALGLPVPDTLVRSEPLPLPVLLPPRLPSSGR
jgi:hypothetical protein